MQLATFISQNRNALIAECRLDPALRTAFGLEYQHSGADFPDFFAQLLDAIAIDMNTTARDFSELMAASTAANPDPAMGAAGAVAHIYGLSCARNGGSSARLVVEYGALRRHVLNAWAKQAALDCLPLDEVIRFNEILDRVAAQSVSSFLLENARHQRDLAATLRHDLRGHLNAITLNCEVLATLNRDAALGGCVTRLTRSSEHMKTALESYFSKGGAL